MKLILTCEHAGNEIPQEFQYLFENVEKVLNSHRGYDLGAFDLFEVLKKLFSFSSFQNYSRLLIEMNRSLNNPELFSEFTKPLSSEEKNRLLETYYFPYRNAVENEIRKEIEKGEEVLHFSVHTFTPKLNGEIRNVDIGLLFDPAKKKEKGFCGLLKKQFADENPGLQVKFNYPYLGTADGFTTYLRKKFPQQYLGIELEVNQKYAMDGKMDSQLKTMIFKSLLSISNK